MSDSARPFAARKLRKSHCGISAMYFVLTGKCDMSPIVSGVSPNCPMSLKTF